MQITRNLHSINLPFSIPIGPGHSLRRSVNVFLLFGDRIVLIDSGVARAKEQIFEYIRSHGRNPSDISLLVLTHTHPDHIGAARAIKDETGCEVAVHEAERAWIEDVDRQARERPIPGFHELVGGSVAPDRLLRAGDMIDAGKDLTLEVIHTPGHSSGSISLLLRKERVLITGDAIPLPGDVPVYDDYPASVRSIELLKGIGNCETLLSSWDTPRTGDEIAACLDNGLLYLRRIHESVVTCADGHPDPMDLCRSVAAELGLPPLAATPHLARSFQANVRHHRSQSGSEAGQK